MSLVAQYIYYYKPPLPSSPDYSPTSSRSASLAMTLTPNAVLYSPRNLTRPSSRTPLLVEEVEAGYRTYDKRARSQTGSSRYSGVLSSYPPAGLLPSAEEVDGKGKARQQSSKHSISSLRQPVEKFVNEDKEEEDDELSAMAESFYSDVSAAAADRGGIQRHVSWSGVEDTTGDNTPRQGIIPHPPLIKTHEPIPSTSSADQQPAAAATTAEGLRMRSRSRGRASRRHRPTPLLVYELASPTGLIPTAGTITSGLDSDGNPLSAAQLLHMEQRERDSKSGSRRRRSASIVFLSVGFGALLAFGGSTGPVRVSLSVADAGVSHGQVLGVDMPSSPWESTRPSIQAEFVPLYSQEEEEVRSTRRRRPHDTPPLTREQKRRLLGRISAWACTTLYLTSRLPQIWKNYTRKSVQGLSLALFVFAFLGNTFYVASILSSPTIWEYPPDAGEIVSEPPYNSPRARAFIQESLPYLLGSAGTLCFDVIIVSQGIIYGRREKRRLEEEEDESESDEGASLADGESSVEDGHEASREGVKADLNAS